MPVFTVEHQQTPLQIHLILVHLQPVDVVESSHEIIFSSISDFLITFFPKILNRIEFPLLVDLPSII